MATSEQTVKVFEALELSSIDEDWVQRVWEDDLEEVELLPLAVKEAIAEREWLCTELQATRNLLAAWLRQRETDNGEGLWTVLMENDIPYKALIALLACLIEAGSKIDAEMKQAESAILAACNYFYLIAAPGSSAFKIYNPQLFLKAADLLKIWSRLDLGSSKRKRSDPSENSSQQSKKPRKSRQTKEPRQPSDIISSQFSEDEEAPEWNPQEKDVVKEWLKILLQDLVLLLEHFSLKQSESTLFHIIQSLAEIAGMEPEGIGNLQNWPALDRMAPSHLAIRGLVVLCTPMHGQVGAATSSVYKNLLPYLLMLTKNNKVCTAQTIPRPLIEARDAMLQVVRHICHLTGERGHTPIRTLLQHMCTKVPDRAEYRTKVAQGVVAVLKEVPDPLYASFMEWLNRLSQHSKINNRVIALEIVSLLLSMPPRVLQGEIPSEVCEFTSQRCLVSILLERCSDSAPSVRARAISGFSSCLLSGDAAIVDIVRSMVTPGPQVNGGPQRLVPTPGGSDRSERDGNVSGRDTGQAEKSLEAPGSGVTISYDGDAANSTEEVALAQALQNIVLTPFNPNLPDAQGVVSMLQRRTRDEKVNVRKAAVQAVESFLHFQIPSYAQENVEVLVKCCGDPSLSVRKQAMHSLTSVLLASSSDTYLQSAWLNGVLPLVMDVETSLQEGCVETLQEVLLQKIVPYTRSMDDCHRLAWSLIAVMAKEENEDIRRYLQRACRQFAQMGKVKASHIAALQTHVNTENMEGAWLLLEMLSSSFPQNVAKFIDQVWEESARHSSEMKHHTLVRVLHVIGSVAKHLTAERRAYFIDDLKKRLHAFDSPPIVVSSLVNTLSKLCNAEGSSEGRSENTGWCKDLLMACDAFLSSIILEGNCSLTFTEEEQLVSHLFTLGEIAQLSPSLTPRRIFVLVQSLIAAPCLPTGESLDEIYASQGLQNTQSSQGSQGSQGSQPLSQFRGSWMTPRVRAFAFITLGKLCLQNEDLAKKCVAALARELEISSDLTIRNNVVVIMCDLCVRYSTLVDNHVINIAACLKDEAPLIRKQTLTLMTRLLQEDFLKWKGVLFYRFITTLLDEIAEIRSFAEYCLVQLLLPRQPNMLFQHFVECIFHFNAYLGHSVYNKFQQSDNERKLFALHGKQNTSKRLQLYLFMLDHMSDQHRFHLTAKVAQEILGGVVDGILPLDADTSLLLEDALAILSSKEIKLTPCRFPNQDNSEENEMVAAVKKTLITQVMKRNVIENVIPIVISLKQMLEKQRSPLLRNLMGYLRELMKDFKNEVKDWLSADRQLAAELEFDLQQFESQEQRASPAEPPGAAQQTEPSHKSPSTSVSGGRKVSPAGGRMVSPAGGRMVSPAGGRVVSSAGGRVVSPAGGRVVSPAGGRVVSPAGGRMVSPAAVLLAPGSGSTKSSVTTPQTPQASSGTTPRSDSPRVQAMVASARQALERVRRLRQDASSPLGKRRSQHCRPECENQNPGTPTQSPDKERRRNPRKGRAQELNRAISTPTCALGHITFTGDRNMSIIPPSPIPSALPIRLYSSASEDNGKRHAGAVCTDSSCGSEQRKNADMVYMFSPDKKLPKPRKWKIKTPAGGHPGS